MIPIHNSFCLVFRHSTGSVNGKQSVSGRATNPGRQILTHLAAFPLNTRARTQDKLML